MLSRYTLHPFDPCFDAKQHNRYTVDKARWEEQVRANQHHFISRDDERFVQKGEDSASRGAGGDGGLAGAQGRPCRGTSGSQVSTFTSFPILDLAIM